MNLKATSLLMIALAAVTVSAQKQVKTEESPPSLNHFYHVFDQKTFDAILRSKFIRDEFAATDGGMPNFAAPAVNAGNLYVRGARTYLELLGENNSFKEPKGKGGIGFSVETTGELKNLFGKLSAARGADNYERATQSWTFADGAKLDWYDVVYPIDKSENAPANTVDYWFSEYRRQFFERLYPNRKLSAAGNTRVDFLAAQYKSERLLRDVTKLKIALPAKQKQGFINDLIRLGFKLIDDKIGGEKTLKSVETTFEIVDETAETKGIISATMTLNRAVKPQKIYRFGVKSELILKGRMAVWTF